eukprot:6664437-Prymnesium_polylepis.2
MVPVAAVGSLVPGTKIVRTVQTASVQPTLGLKRAVRASLIDILRAKARVQTTSGRPRATRRSMAHQQRIDSSRCATADAAAVDWRISWV